MRCDGSPDPSVLQEINTFITLWRENSEAQVKPVLQQCDLALKVKPFHLTTNVANKGPVHCAELVHTYM